jgi:hypothetical protein
MSERVQEDVKSALASLNRHLEGASPLFVESFKTTFVFDVSQTEPLPGADPAPLEPPRQPLTGDSPIDGGFER